MSDGKPSDLAENLRRMRGRAQRLEKDRRRFVAALERIATSPEIDSLKAAIECAREALNAERKPQR